MAAADESSLVAIRLAPSAAVAAIRAAWDVGAAVTVLDPADRSGTDIARLAPTHLHDADGCRAVGGGTPVPVGVGAVVTTSGTTGAPRAVMLDHEALAHSARAVTAALGLGPTDRWLACLPLHHVAGLAIVARSAHTAVPLSVHDRFDPAAVADAAGPCTVVSLVPTTLRRLLDHSPAALGRFRRVLVGGAPAPVGLLTAARTHTTVVTTYGLTETGGGCVHDGHPLPEVTIELAPGTDEVLVAGPVVMRGHRDGDDADAWHAPGVLRTGDVGRIDSDGRLEIVDRIKDLIITGGVNVSPTRIEDALRGGPIADIAIVGEPDPEWGERVVAWVVPAGDPPTLDALRARGRSLGLRDAELPRELRLTPVIPRSAGGKTLRRMLRNPTDRATGQLDGS